MNVWYSRVLLPLCILSCLLTCLLLLFPQPVEAHGQLPSHAQYDHSDPPANARLPAGHPPSRVQVWFTEQVDPLYSSLAVYDQARQRVDLHNSHSVANDPYALSISVRPHLPDAVYTVVFHTVSAEDGHVVTSGFSFVVGGAPLPTSTGALLSQDQMEDTNFNIESILTRWLNYLAMAGLVGGLLFFLLVWQPTAARLRATIGSGLEKAYRQMERRMYSFLLESIVLLLVGWMAFLVYQGCVTSAATPWEVVQNGTLPALLLHSRFGTIWLVRLALILLAGLLWFLRGPRRTGQRNSILFLWSMLLSGMGIIATSSLNSHAAGNKMAALLVPLDMLHLASTGFWIGGLLSFVLVLPVAQRTFVPGTGDRTRALAALIPFFTRIALFSVVLLALTGSIQALDQLGVQDALFQGHFQQVQDAFLGNGYGRAIVVKSCLFALLIGFGAFHARRISPRMHLFVSRSGDESGSGSLAAGRLQRLFQRSVRTELLVALVLLLVVGALTSLSPPPPPVQATTASRGPFLHEGQMADLRYQLAVNPGTVGPNTFEVSLTAADGQPLQHADDVLIYFTMLDMDMGTEVLKLMPVAQHAGHYRADTSALAMTGHWSLQLIVRRSGFDEAKTTIPYSIQP